MPLIKSASTAVRLQPFSMRDIEDQARGMLLAAKHRADRFLAEAQKAGEQLKVEAHAQGLADGYKEGLAKGRAEGLKAGRDAALKEHQAKLSALIASLTAAAGALDKSRRELEAAATRDVIALAIAIAQRVTKRLADVDPRVAVANVNEAMKLVAHASDIRIALHPAQKATMEEALPAIKATWPALAHVELVVDAALTPGSCRIYTAHGRIDGDIEEQLRRVASDLVPSSAEPTPADPWHGRPARDPQSATSDPQ